jgi:PIN domain nuclease of toxin-antitoxin system
VRLLLDTHVVLWWTHGGARIKVDARRALERAEEIYVSAASEWEVAIKVACGKLTVPGLLIDAVSASGFSPLPIDFAHAAAVRALPRLHSDPFDRILIAQAQVEALHLVSHDPVLATYPVSFLWA